MARSLPRIENCPASESSGDTSSFPGGIGEPAAVPPGFTGGWMLGGTAPLHRPQGNRGG
jgi:hypothetical protein